MKFALLSCLSLLASSSIAMTIINQKLHAQETPEQLTPEPTFQDINLNKASRQIKKQQKILVLDLDQIFDEVDTNKDGELTSDEWKQGTKGEGVWEDADADKNGSVNKQEFQNYFKTWSKEQAKTDLQNLKSQDKNGDGIVDETQYKEPAASE